MSIRGVLFDLDGTLVDSIPDIARAVDHALAVAGLGPLPTELYPQLVGWGLPHLVSEALRRLGADPGSAAEVTQATVAYYERHPVVDTRAYPGIPQVLGELRRRGIKLAVVTNKRHSVAQQVVDGVFGEGVFEIVIGESPGQPKKPDPRVAHEVFAALGVGAAECVMVGDSAVDIQFARAAGIPVIGVGWGFRGPEELKEADGLAYESEDILRRILGF